ncbi:MAG: Hsp70 family protein [Filimonas sp.]|nr:Hsp70 family protein [Filimonas sp.]
MSATINFGIDLGTTNSLIAKCTNGAVEVFKNPAGHKETLPSVVGFRKERILVGDKAREYIEKDPSNVFSSFKRKMGTSESFFVPNLGDFKTPVQLSSMVLKELKNFIYSGEALTSAIITIPASFDTVQSNATKQAGYDAGLYEVILLQEPVAACLAFANKGTEKISDGKWLVYDFGGGTFDVALVYLQGGEMQVADHEGNNYLGGLDFDNLIIDQLIIPQLAQKGTFDDLHTGLKSASGKYNKLYYELLYKAEEAKIMLSNANSADIEFEIEDVHGDVQDIFLTITRDDYNKLIQPVVEQTISFTKAIIERNKLGAADIQEIVLVGGSTYTPLIRQLLFQQLNIPVNATVDPTTAVAVGAAYFAASKAITVEKTVALATEAVAQGSAYNLQVRTAYQKNSNEREEYFSALIKGDWANCYYRITRDDGGFDSGIKPLKERIEEILTLLPDTLNQFTLRLFDDKQSALDVTVAPIQIMQGKFSIYGQPLPSDICIEVDDTYNKTTYLELLFEKNAILPIKKSITKTLSRTIVKGSDDQLLINILEGSRYATPQSNLPIGVIVIAGKDIQADLIKGSDVDLSIEITESRDIKINAYVNITGQEYEQVFTPTVRNVNTSRLLEETDYLLRLANRNQTKLVEAEDYEASQNLQSIITRLEEMKKRLRYLPADDVTDEKYQLEDQKRKLSLQIDMLGKDNRVREIREEYYGRKEAAEYYLREHAGKEDYAKRFQHIISNEGEFLNGSEATIRRKCEELSQLVWDMKKRNFDYIVGVFTYYAMKEDHAYNNPAKAKQLKERGDAAITRRSGEELLSIVSQLYHILIDKDTDEPLKGTGLG